MGAEKRLPHRHQHSSLSSHPGIAKTQILDPTQRHLAGPLLNNPPKPMDLLFSQAPHYPPDGLRVHHYSALLANVPKQAQRVGKRPDSRQHMKAGT